MNPRGQAVDDDLVNLGLLFIAAVTLLATVLRLAATVAAWLSAVQQPSAGWEAGFRVLRQPADPGAAPGAGGLAPWAYCLVLALMLGAGIASSLPPWRRVGAFKQKTTRDPRHLAGVATGPEVRAVAPAGRC